jgi:hypothetical protein
MKILTFLANTENFTTACSNFSIGITSPKEKNMAARTPYFGKQEKKYETVEDILLDFFIFKFHQAAPDLPGLLADNFS